MTKLNKDNLRQSFRPALRINRIAELGRKDPNHIYKEVRQDEHLDPNAERIERYMDSGWEVVTSTEKLLDDRATAPDNDQTESLRPHPVIRNGKGGAQFVLMKIKKEKWEQNQQDKKKKNDDKFLRSTVGRKVKQEGNEIQIQDGEVNEQNVNSSQNNNN